MFYIIVVSYKVYYVSSIFCQAIRRQVPDLGADIDELMTSPLTNVSDIQYVIRLEKEMEMEKTNHRLSTVSQKLETLEIESNNIKGILDLL